MHHFFIPPDAVRENDIVIRDEKDQNHIKNVLRLRPGEALRLSCPENGREYLCRLAAYCPEGIRAEIEDVCGKTRELPVEITLYQGLPKSGKMDFIIQKAVELGASRIVPVATARSVVKLDGKRAGKKVARWQEIAKSAAEQSMRSRIPAVGDVMDFSDALTEAKRAGMILFPYEDARGIAYARSVIREAGTAGRLAVFIGPEGGFSGEEAALAREAGAKILTLGRRILRTETAGMAVLAILMFSMEEDGEI